MHTLVFRSGGVCIRRSLSASRLLLPALLLLLTVWSGMVRAEIKLTTDFKDGDKVSDVATIVAHADAPDGIDKVEFRVDEDLKKTAVSVPYEFAWDTIADKEGEHKISITAIDANGQTKRVMLSLTVDNELSMGADTLAQKALDALTAKDEAAARRYARRALKADPDNVTAARVNAGLFANGQKWDDAIASLEKVKGLDTNADAMLELAGYRLHRALLPENAGTQITEIQAISELRHKAADLAVAKAKKQNTADDNKSVFAVADALINAGQYGQAAELLRMRAQKDEATPEAINRYALALALNNALEDAITVVKTAAINKKADANSRAIQGLALLRQRKFAQAREAVVSDVTGAANPNAASLVIAAYADSVLGKRTQAQAEAKDAVKLAPNAGDAYYALSMSYPLRNNGLLINDSEDALFKALELSPFHNGPYLDYATRMALTKGTDRYDQALNLTDFALKQDPNNINAKLMQALIYVQTKRLPEAETVMRSLYKTNPGDPDVLTVVAAYWDAKGDNAKVDAAQQGAVKADALFTPLVKTSPAPLRALEFMNRSLHYRGGFYLTLASLFPNG